MTYFITITGRRWPAEETFKTGKDVYGWDQCQARTFDGICRHTALAALAQFRCLAVRSALHSEIQLPATAAGSGRDSSAPSTTALSAALTCPARRDVGQRWPARSWRLVRRETLADRARSGHEAADPASREVWPARRISHLICGFEVGAGDGSRTRTISLRSRRHSPPINLARGGRC